MKKRSFFNVPWASLLLSICFLLLTTNVKADTSNDGVKLNRSTITDVNLSLRKIDLASGAVVHFNRNTIFYGEKKKYPYNILEKGLSVEVAGYLSKGKIIAKRIDVFAPMSFWRAHNKR